MKKSNNNLMYLLGFVIFLIWGNMIEGSISILGGIFLTVVLGFWMFLLRKKYDKNPEVLTEDCSMDEQV